MSYEPTIIALKKDLDKHENYIRDGLWEYSGTKEFKDDQKIKTVDDGTVMECIRDAYKNATAKIGGIEIVLLTPNLSSFNKAVRDKLTSLKVEFSVIN